MTIQSVDISPDTPDRIVSRNILRIIERRGLRHTDLQRAMHVGEGWFSSRLRGKVRWSVEDLFAACAALGVDPATVLSGGRGWSATA